MLTSVIVLSQTWCSDHGEEQVSLIFLVLMFWPWWRSYVPAMTKNYVQRIQMWLSLILGAKGKAYQHASPTLENKVSTTLAWHEKGHILNQLWFPYSLIQSSQLSYFDI